MVSSCKKRQSNRKLLSQLDDLDEDNVFGNTASDRQENTIVNESTGDQVFTAGTSDKKLMTNENTINVKTSESCFNERFDKEMSNIVDTVEDRIQNALLIAIDSIVAPKFELAFRSINASSGRDATSATANSERGERIGITAHFENASEKINVLHISNSNVETRDNIPDEVSELSVPGTRFDRQSHAHHVSDCFFIELPEFGN